MAATVSVNSHNFYIGNNFNKKLDLIVSKSYDFQAKVFI